MLSFLTAVLYPLFNKMDMMFRRAGAMRCNCIFLHQEEPPKRLMEGKIFSFGFLVSYDCSFWSAAGLWRSPTGWRLRYRKLPVSCVGLGCFFFYHFSSKCGFFSFLVLFFQNFSANVRSSCVQFRCSWFCGWARGTGINALLKFKK